MTTLPCPYYKRAEAAEMQNPRQSHRIRFVTRLQVFLWKMSHIYINKMAQRDCGRQGAPEKTHRRPHVWPQKKAATQTQPWCLGSSSEASLLNVSLQHRYWVLFRIPVSLCWWSPVTGSKRWRGLLTLCRFFPKLPEAQAEVGKWLWAWGVYAWKATSKLTQWLHRLWIVFLLQLIACFLF